MSDHVIDGVQRGLHETAIERQATGWRRGSPPLPDLTHDESLRPECLGLPRYVFKRTEAGSVRYMGPMKLAWTEIEPRLRQLRLLADDLKERFPE